MATLANRTLAYLGLKDLEAEELFEDDYGEVPAPLRKAPSRAGRPLPLREEPEPQRFASRHTYPGSDEEEMATGALSLVRPLIPPTTAHLHVVAPESFDESHRIGDLVRQADPLVVNLQVSDRRLARRMIDFCSGLTYALGGSMTKVADLVFLLTPAGVEVVVDERVRTQEHESRPATSGQKVEVADTDSEMILAGAQEQDDPELVLFDEAPDHKSPVPDEPSWERRLVWDWDEQGGDQESVQRR